MLCQPKTTPLQSNSHKLEMEGKRYPPANFTTRKRRSILQRTSVDENDESSLMKDYLVPFFKIIEYGVSWLRKLSEIPTGH